MREFEPHYLIQLGCTHKLAINLLRNQSFNFNNFTCTIVLINNHKYIYLNKIIRAKIHLTHYKIDHTNFLKDNK